MNIPRSIRAAALAAVGALSLSNPATAQLPFDITQDDLQAVDTTALHWTSVQTYVGGVDGELRYRDPEVAEGECRAVALLGLLRLRNHYRRERGEAPVAIRLALRCAATYLGNLRYDGVVVQLELRDAATGELVYRGRRRGLP